DSRAMTATQRIALIEIGDAGPLRLNDLAGRMGTSAPTASRAVDVLGELGLVARAPDADDRRAVRIELTPAGRELVDERKARAGAAFEPAVAALPAADRERLFKLLARMTEALSPPPEA
ncbi:MAG TPA: MarR family transcriptional regulator, partial [Gaiellaceae bacterium]|nr:MarR family transcriptional regulator [Gaiellaceae bacterium]